jgi:ABC-type lipoprotein export system ATPase subunit
MIEIRSLEFSYPRSDFRLSIPSLKVARGEKVAFIGPSGSGKTTLLNLISGISIPESGSVRVGQAEVSALQDAARRDYRIANVGFVFQDFELLDYLDITDNILHTYRITGALKLTDDVRNRARQLADGMGIEDKLNRYPSELSQGERQRAAICRALLSSPGLILADEATGNLDPRNKGHILNLLFENAEAHNATLLAVTHDHELLPNFDRVIDFQSFLDVQPA